MSNTFVSFIRTYVPVAVGALISWLVAHDIVLDEEAQTGLTIGLTGLVIALYYLVARLLERKWPIFGFLLGTVKVQPVYQAVNTQAQQDKTA
jgi:uncharacterized membrane protein